VAGGGQRPQGQAAEIDLVAVAEAPVAEGPPPGGGGENFRAVVVGELDGAGEEVGVQVGVGSERDGETTPGSRRPQGP
jgi:hypothetical protein